MDDFGALGRGTVTWHCLLAKGFDQKGGEAAERPGRCLGGHILNVCSSTSCVHAHFFVSVVSRLI